MNVGVYFPNVPPEIGGGYTFENEVLGSLLSLAHESRHCFTLFSDTAIQKIAPANTIPPIKNEIIPRPTVIKRFFGVTPKISNFESLVLKNKIEMMIYSNAFYCNPTINVPYITFVWDLQHRLQPWFPEVSAKGEWERRESYFKNALQRATYIVTGTKTGQKEISLFYGIPENRIKILPHPTPEFKIKNSESDNTGNIPKKYGISKQYLLYPAQFWPHKNHVNCLLALKMIKEQHSLPLSLVLVGSDAGNMSYIKKRTIELELSDDVHFLGFISRSDLISLYRDAFALLYLSFFGPENLPPLEAFALQCPVLASRVSGSEEQLGDAALLVDPKDPEDIAKAIVKLYDDKELRSQLIWKGYSRAHQWSGKEFIRGLFTFIDDFECIRRCWE